MLISRKRFFKIVSDATDTGRAIGAADCAQRVTVVALELGLRTAERDEALDVLNEARVLLKQITDNLSAISLASGTEPETLKRLNELLEVLRND